jgi:hypothetical protein
VPKNAKVLLLAMTAGWLVAAPAAAVAAPCDATVLDKTSHRVLGNQQEVDAEAQKLEVLGATVRVRVLQHAPRDNFDLYLSRQLDRCGSWHDKDGSMKDNLVVFAVSMDHPNDLYLFYGPRWSASLDGNSDSVVGAYYVNTSRKHDSVTIGISSAMAQSFWAMSGQFGHAGNPAPKPEDRSAGIKIVFFIAALGLLNTLFWTFRPYIKRHREARRESDPAEERVFTVSR